VAKAKAAKVVLRDGLRSDEPHGLYFKEQVRRELVERFGWQRVYQGGLRVFTTIDMPMQEVAEAAIAEQIQVDRGTPRPHGRLAGRPRRSWRRTRRRHRLRARPTCSRARSWRSSRTPGTCGRWSAAATFDASHFNRAVQAHRQPGSAFKPFVYATAIEAGYSPATVIDHLDEPGRNRAGSMDAGG
jgi:penicillin-binding protein 1A